MLKKAVIYGQEVEYEDTEFKVVPNTFCSEEFENIPEYLQYIGDGVNIRNPKGNIIAIGMFQGYEGEKIDLSNFDAKGIVRMDYMFAYSKLRTFSADLDTKNVISVQGMFEGCNDLLLVDIGTCDLSRVEDYSNFCADCGSLVGIFMGFVDSVFVPYNEVYVENMFINCASLKTAEFLNMGNVFVIDTILKSFSDRLSSGCVYKSVSKETLILGSNNHYINKTIVHY